MDILYYENYDLTNVVTPVNPDKLKQMLIESNYDEQKTQFLTDGFRNSFSLGYQGKQKIRLKSSNLELRVGSEIELWNKVMKEVKLKRYAGPYRDRPPFEYYIQSPIGLVPKDNGKDTQLIFHLSYPRSGANLGSSVNSNTPKHLATVSYKDFDDAIRRCLEEGKNCKLSQSDVKSAFRVVGIAPKYWKFLVMKACNPLDGKIYYFVDKCLLFGASISCAIFQKISDAIGHLVQHKTGKEEVNYLDDFLFLALLKWLCDQQTRTFMDICHEVGIPINLDKTFWATLMLTFLGLLIDTLHQMVFLPKEKTVKGQELIEGILNRRSKKVTIKEMQKLCEFLNFLG